MTRPTRPWLLALLAALAAGCGDDDDATPPTRPKGTGGAAGTAGQAGSGAGTAGGSAAGGGAGGAAGGAAGGSAAGGGAAGAPECNFKRVSYTGTVDGAPVSVDAPKGLGVFDSTAPSMFYQQPGAGWMLFTSPADFPKTAATTFPAAEALLLGAWAGAGETWYCGQDATLTAVDASMGHYTFAIPTLRRLGACPGGTPVEGSIEVCYDPGSTTACQQPLKNGGSYTLAGSVDGSALPAQAATVNPGGADANQSVFFEVDERRALSFLVDEAGTTRVLLMLPEAGTSGHRLYCAEGIPALDPVTRRLEGTLTGLSRLGACADAPAVGSLAGCY